MPIKKKKLDIAAEIDPDAEAIPEAKPDKLSDQQLADRYDQTSARILQERNDFLLPTILEMVSSKKWINLHPEYQRRSRWDDKKKSLLIESILMNIPIPPVFLFEKDLGRWEVMDGQQRLSSIVEFYSNKLKLTGLEFWPDLNGRTYSKCPRRIKRGLDRRRISAVTLLAESQGSIGANDADIRLQVFKRLNTGGTTLNPQELRNCVYTGDFNDLVVRLARQPLFTAMWDIPPYNANTNSRGEASDLLKKNKLYQTMGDCQIVLRFFAFRDSRYIVGSVRKMLNKCMERNEDLSKTEIPGLEADFVSRLQIVHSIFGKDAFKLPIQPNSLSRPLFDALMIAVDQLWNERKKLIAVKIKIRKRFPILLQSKKNYSLIVGKPNTSSAVKDRIRTVKKFLAAQI